VRLAEAPSHGLPVLRYDKGSRGATAYLALAGEYLRRHAPPPAPAKESREAEPAGQAQSGT
jgi:chromosome partitioning protein